MLDIVLIVASLYLVGTIGAVFGYLSIDVPERVIFRRCWLWPIHFIQQLREPRDY